jgi:transglutaminase-like putative cysteine protease
MDEGIIRAAFDKWTAGRDPVAARVSLFEHVRDIPYRYPASRDPAEVLRQRAGSCSGKHYLLGDLYRLQGLKVRNMICRHRFNESPLPFPAAMQALLVKNEIVDLHDYLQVQIDGEWVEIDATWELALRDFGFPVTDDWDGRRPMLLSVVVDEEFVVEADPARRKEEMLSKLTPRQRQLRKQFLESLASWVQDLTAEVQREGDVG